MRFRKLRIAFSATCLIACILLIALWVRSYRNWNYLTGPLSATRLFQIGSDEGNLTACLLPRTEFYTEEYGPLWKIHNVPFQNGGGNPVPVRKTLGVRLQFAHGAEAIWVSDWLAVTIFGGIGVALAVGNRFHFSLRTLLFAITAVAVTLGVLVWAAR
jgi:hypothetical protein